MASVFSALFLAGCGGGGSSSSTPSPQPIVSSSSSSNSSSLGSSTLSSSTSSSVIPSSASSNSSSSSSSSSSVLTLGVAADIAMKNLLASTGATAATFAVAKNGQIIYEKAYGFQDATQKIPLTTDVLMRTGSIIKPVTAAAIRVLAKNGTLSLSDHVFCTGNNAPCWLAQDLLPSTIDARVKDITIQHVIAHKGGWLVSISDDAAYMEVEIKNSLKLNRPPTREEIIKYYMAKPLGYAPGQELTSDFNTFSNFGYLLLGMIVEKASKKTYTQFVQTEIMAQLGVSDSDFKAGSSRLIDRDSREPAYLTNAMCTSVYTGNSAICAEEMREVKNWLSVGFSLTTARAMALFAQHYTLAIHDYGLHDSNTGLALEKYPTAYGRFNGDMEGLTSVVKQLPSGVSYAVFINKTIIDATSSNLPYYSDYFDQSSQLVP